MTTQDNKFPVLVTAQANWETDLATLARIAERGYHVTAQAGVAISTGNVLWMNSGAFFFPFDPNSLAIAPNAMAYTAANSGDTLTALTRGIVRSLGINSPAIPGKPLYVSASTPGLIVASYAGADRQVGWGIDGYSILFDPIGLQRRLSAMVDVDTTGVTQDSVLKWSNTSSKWVVAVDSSGSGSGAVTLITEHIVVGSEASVTFASISSGYRDLIVRVRGRSLQGAVNDQINAQFNADTGSNYYMQIGWFNGAAGAGVLPGEADKIGFQFAVWVDISANSSYTKGASFQEILIPDYVSSGNFQKTYRSQGGFWQSLASSKGFAEVGYGVWNNNSRITSIKVFLNSGSSFYDQTVISLYGST